MTIDKKIKAVYEIEEIDGTGLISTYFDCDLMSVVSVVTKESGFIIPSPLDGTVVEYGKGDTGGEMTLYGEMDYNKVVYSLESSSDIDSAFDIISDSERYELQSSHVIDSDAFSGYIERIQTAVDTSDSQESWDADKIQGDFGIYINEMLA